MNKKKLGKVTGVATASFIIAGTTAFTAFAAMPSGTAVIGNKSYDLNYVNNPANQEEITAAMVAADFKVYVKDFAGNWIVNETEAALTDLSVIPAVAYKAADGTVTNYDAKDGNVVSSVLKVDAVSAVNADTLTVTGTGLDKLTADAFTIDNNSVASITPSADKTSATVKLTYKNLPNAEYTVSIKVGDATQDFKYTFGLTVNTVAVNPVTVDDNKTYQAVTLKINGVDMDVDTLNAAGYIVNFVALDSTGADVSSTFFSDVNSGDLVSSLGVAPGIGDYKVYASVHKDTTVVSSEYAAVKVRNLDQVATTINKYTLTNGSGVVQTSNTLVVGETAQITALNVTANGDTFNTGAITSGVVSSNPGVISVSAGIITANAPGTATVTVTYGDVTKAITFTVTNTARTLTKVTPSSTGFTLILGATSGSEAKTVDIKTYDQYGDPFATNAYLTSSTGTVTAADGGGAVTLTTTPQALDASVYNVTTKVASVPVTFTAAAAGSGSIYITDGYGKVLSSIASKVTSVNNVAKTVLEVLAPLATQTTRSADSNLDMYKDNTVVYNLNKYTTENVFNGKADTSGYYVVYNPLVVGISADGDLSGIDAGTPYLNGLEKIAITDLTDIAVIAAGKGSTDLVIYNATTNLEAGRARITVTDSSPAISGVTFKTAPVVNYIGKVVKASDVLTLTASSNDDIVSGVTLSSASGHATRITETASAPANAGLIYIDKNDNGVFDAGDYALGQVQIKVVTGAIGALTATLDDAITGTNATASGDKATVLFTVQNVNSSTGALVVGAASKVLASTTVTVDVK